MKDKLLKKILIAGNDKDKLAAFLYRDQYEKERLRYQDLQRQLMPGNLTMLAVENPFLLDYGKNPFIQLDVPRNASPKRALPHFTDTRAVDNFLKSQGIKHLVVTDPARSQCLYGSSFWENEKQENKHKHYHQDWLVGMTEYFAFVKEKMADKSVRKVSDRFYIVDF